MSYESLSGATVLVTGAGMGIGKAIALELGASGARVGIVDINADSAGVTAEEIRTAGGAAVGIGGDVSSATSVAEAVRVLTAEFGAPQIVVNNAGILDNFAPLLDTSEELWSRVLSVNLSGMFQVMRATMPAMIAAGGGVFVNMASGAGLVAGLGGTAYTTSKHGVIGLTKQVASDYGSSGIRANCICPGSIDTELSRLFLKDNPEVQASVDGVPAGRQGTAEEIAKLAAFLASADSAFMTGAAVTIDGGWTIR